MDALIDFWQSFRQFDYANEVMMIVGALLLLVSVFRIIRSSLKLVFWVLLAGAGAASVSYGMNGSPIDLPALGSEHLKISNLVGPGKALSGDVLRVLCLRLEESGQL